MDRQSFEALSFALDVVLKATLLIGFAGLIRLFLRRASASLRQAIGVLTLGALLALPAIAPMLPDWKVPVIPTLLAGPEALAEPARGRIETAPLLAKGRGAARPAPAIVTDAPSARSEPSASASATVGRTADFGYGVVPDREVQPLAPSRAALPLPSPATLITMLFVLWGAGAAALLLHLVLGIRRVRRYARHAEPARDERWTELSRELSQRLGLTRPVRFLFTDEVPVAVTAGHFRPMLLLPQAARRWSPELRRVVVLHELAHVRRGDWAVLVLAQVAAAIYWFHPLVWLGVGRLRRDSEQAADDLVLRTGTKPSVYAGHLLGIIRSLRDAAAPSPLPVMGVARPSQFEARLKAILDPAASRREASPGQIRLAASFAAAAVLTLGALQPWKSAEAAVPPSLLDTMSSEQIAGDGSECDSKRKEKKDAEAEEAAVVASLPEDADFARVTADGEDSGSAAEESDADYAHGEEDGAAVPAILAVPGDREPARSENGFVQAGRRSPRDGDDWYDRGMHHHRADEYDEAIAAFKKSIELGHKEGAASYNIACGYALKGEADRAFEWLDRAMEAGFDVSQYIGQDDDLESLESDPRFATYKQKAREARRDLKRKQVERKLARYEQLTRNDPKNGTVWYKLGYELYHLEEYDRAAKAFQQAAALHHEEGASLYNAACMLSLKGDRRSALDHLERAILAGFGSSDKLREDDDLDNIRSEPRYRELLRLAEDLELPDIEQWGWNKFARSKSGVQAEWREAADEIEKFTRQHPEIGRAWFNLGFSRIQSGQPDQAVPAFQKALDLGHRKATSMYNLACAYALLDQKDPAFDWLFRAIEAGAGKGMVRSDPDLDNLRGHPRYREALRLAESKHRGDHDD